jgi:hypothetical protein
MALAQTLTTSFKVELARAIHNFSAAGDLFKIALYTANASLGADTTVYTTVGECSGPGYTAGGLELTNITPVSSGTTAYWSFDNITFPNVTLVTNGALIYNASRNDRSVCVLNFGSNVTKVNQDLVITFPPLGATSAILRIE